MALGTLLDWPLYFVVVIFGIAQGSAHYETRPRVDLHYRCCSVALVFDWETFELFIVVLSVPLRLVVASVEEVSVDICIRVINHDVDREQTIRFLTAFYLNSSVADKFYQILELVILCVAPVV